jgi:hypothetical protein
LRARRQLYALASSGLTGVNKRQDVPASAYIQTASDMGARGGDLRLRWHK